ncbi:MAG: UvrD-helicase domain-containing protein, partial [Humibacillus sp.]|nr:UvrD-helicase domain-containing protein [Humibacillus sp.]
MVILRRAPALVADAVRLDATQRRVLDSGATVLRVLGGPGTGKSMLAVETVVAAVRSGTRADACLVLTSSRSAAATLRQRVTARLDGTSTESLARTWQAFGFGVLRVEATLRGDPAPRLLNGPEQDVILRDLLAGHAAGDAPGPSWPASVSDALTTRGFRNELRDLLMRTVEHGLGPADLHELGLAHERAEWVAAAQVLREYDEVTSFSRHGSYDPAWVLTAAADLLADDRQALTRLHERLDLVVVDDAQELTSAAARLLRVIAPGGPRIVLLGDPDSAVQTFRGADPRFLADGWRELVPDLLPGAPGTRAEASTASETVVLGASARLPEPVAAATLRVSRRIGALGGGAQRGAASRPDPAGAGSVDVALLRSVAQEASHIGSLLRRAHLVEGVAWNEMAVIVRGSGRAATLRRLLASGGVPVTAPATETPVRDETAVRPLLAILEESLAISRARHFGAPHTIDPDRCADLVLSPIGGSDAVSLRRLRRLLRHDELAAGGTRSSDELLSELLVEPGRAQLLGTPARAAARVAGAIEAGVAAAPLAADGRWAAGVTVEQVLWAVWQGSGVAEAWR